MRRIYLGGMVTDAGSRYWGPKRAFMRDMKSGACSLVRAEAAAAGRFTRPGTSAAAGFILAAAGVAPKAPMAFKVLELGRSVAEHAGGDFVIVLAEWRAVANLARGRAEPGGRARPCALTGMLLVHVIDECEMLSALQVAVQEQLAGVIHGRGGEARGTDRTGGSNWFWPAHQPATDVARDSRRDTESLPKGSPAARSSLPVGAQSDCQASIVVAETASQRSVPAHWKTPEHAEPGTRWALRSGIGAPMAFATDASPSMLTPNSYCDMPIHIPTSSPPFNQR